MPEGLCAMQPKGKTGLKMQDETGIISLKMNLLVRGNSSDGGKMAV